MASETGLGIHQRHIDTAQAYQEFKGQLCALLSLSAVECGLHACGFT